METLGVGVDGCKGGWIAVSTEAKLYSSLAELLGEFPDAQVAIDMPIGLGRRGAARDCDRKARALLASRACCIFSAPPRAALEFYEYSQLKGWGLSIQSFHLFPKIRELDSWITPERQSRLREAHPELAFRQLALEAGTPLPLASKRTLAGRQQRKELLGADLPALAKSRSGVRASLDDFLDACVLQRVATKMASGREQSCGGQELDERGLRMEICF